MKLISKKEKKLYSKFNVFISYILEQGVFEWRKGYVTRSN